MKETRVLVLDDEENILASIERLFRDESFALKLTTSYKEAAAILETERIKVVMADQRMPEISGVDFLREVKEKYPDTLRILFTGYADAGTAEDAINKGEVYRFINKPWDNQELKTTIREALEKVDLIEKNRELSSALKKQNKELLELNSKLKNMYEAQKEFSSKVSHELGTPLASIKLMIEIVMSKTTGDLTEEQKKFLNKAKENINRLARLIKDILSLARMESKAVELNIQRADINKIIADAALVHGPFAAKQGLYLRTRLYADMPEIFFDADKIRQVLDNLVNNSIKFTDHGGILIMSNINGSGNYVTISVEDTGCGIGEEDKPKLFEKFQQVGKTAGENEKGTGLGLAICKEIISQHNGKIWVESERGKGSVFSFILPIRERRKG